MSASDFVDKWPAEVQECLVAGYADAIAEKVIAGLIEGAYRIPQAASDQLAKDYPSGCIYQNYVGYGPSPLRLETQIVSGGRIRLRIENYCGEIIWQAELRP